MDKLKRWETTGKRVGDLALIGGGVFLMIVFSTGYGIRETIVFSPFTIAFGFILGLFIVMGSVYRLTIDGEGRSR